MTDRGEEEEEEGGGKTTAVLVGHKRPRKGDFRCRAHCNPLSFHTFSHPTCPQDVPWSEYFPTFFSSDETSATPLVRFADVGCGYGGLIVSLAQLFPHTLMLGLEIRDPVVEYVQLRIQELRTEHPDGSYGNAWCVRTNAMKYLPNYFHKGQLHKMFFLFPDPHFKRKNHRRRIISPILLSEYAYVMADEALLYTITDVKELHEWMVSCLEEHPLFERIEGEELEKDPCVPLVRDHTEEGMKVERNQGDKYLAVYRRHPRVES